MSKRNPSVLWTIGNQGLNGSERSNARTNIGVNFSNPSVSGNEHALEFLSDVNNASGTAENITFTKKKVTVDGAAYDPTSTNPASSLTIAEAIKTLDVNDITGFGKAKTLATLSETDGKISATFQDIEATWVDNTNQWLKMLYVTSKTSVSELSAGKFASGLSNIYVATGHNYLSVNCGEGLYIDNRTTEDTFGKLRLYLAGADQLGGVKLGYTETTDNFALKTDSSGHSYVTVPLSTQLGNLRNFSSISVNPGATGAFTVNPATNASTLKLTAGSNVSLTKPSGTNDTIQISSTDITLSRLSVTEPVNAIHYDADNYGICTTMNSDTYTVYGAIPSSNNAGTDLTPLYMYDNGSSGNHVFRFAGSDLFSQIADSTRTYWQSSYVFNRGDIFWKPKNQSGLDHELAIWVGPGTADTWENITESSTTRDYYYVGRLMPSSINTEKYTSVMDYYLDYRLGRTQTFWYNGSIQSVDTQSETWSALTGKISLLTREYVGIGGNKTTHDDAFYTVLADTVENANLGSAIVVRNGINGRYLGVDDSQQLSGGGNYVVPVDTTKHVCNVGDVGSIDLIADSTKINCCLTFNGGGTNTRYASYTEISYYDDVVTTTQDTKATAADYDLEFSVVDFGDSHRHFKHCVVTFNLQSGALEGSLVVYFKPIEANRDSSQTLTSYTVGVTYIYTGSV